MNFSQHDGGCRCDTFTCLFSDPRSLDVGVLDLPLNGLQKAMKQDQACPRVELHKKSPNLHLKNVWLCKAGKPEKGCTHIVAELRREQREKKSSRWHHGQAGARRRGGSKIQRVVGCDPMQS